VLTTPGANSNAVAEEVVALMLADARHLVEADPSCRRGEWEKTKFMAVRSPARLLVFSAWVTSVNSWPNVWRVLRCACSAMIPWSATKRAKEIGVELVDLPTLFGAQRLPDAAHPGNAETKGWSNAALFGKMKKGATLINLRPRRSCRRGGPARPQGRKADPVSQRCISKR